MPRSQQLLRMWMQFGAHLTKLAETQKHTGIPALRLPVVVTVQNNLTEEPGEEEPLGRTRTTWQTSLWLQHNVFEPAALNIHPATAQVPELHGIQQHHSHQTKTAGRMLRDTRQHVRGKVLLECASISGGARTETSTTIMTEGARERKSQDTLTLNLLSDLNISTSALSFLSSQTGVRTATKKHSKNPWQTACEYHCFI